MRRRTYRALAGAPYPLCIGCEHCDSEHSPRAVRDDPLRGQVCPTCDLQLDEMFTEMDEPGDSYRDQDAP